MATTANKVKYGISNVHYAIATRASDGSITYGAWKELPNAVSITCDVNSNTSTQYADNKLIYSKTCISGTNITLTMSVISDDFKKEVLGWKTTSDGGLVQVSNATTEYIALGFQFEGDVNASKIWYYLCSVSDQSNDDASTNTESVTFSNEALTITAYPVTIGNDDVIKTTYRADDTGYATLFTGTPKLPTIA